MGFFDFLRKKTEEIQIKNCNHSYVCIGKINVNEEVNPIFYYVCKRCGKRKSDMDEYTRMKTADWFKSRLKMWESNQYELTDADFSSQYMTDEAIFLESCLEKEIGQ
jgi:hypothetical protein